MLPLYPARAGLGGVPRRWAGGRGAPGAAARGSRRSRRRRAGERARRGSAAESAPSWRSRRCRRPARPRSSPLGGVGSGLARRGRRLAVAGRRRARLVIGRRVGRRRRCVLASQRSRHRALDVLLRARVVTHVPRQDLDRVVVAVHRVRAVHAAVVVPVVDHLPPARLGRGSRPGERKQREDESGQQEQPGKGWPDRLGAVDGGRQGIGVRGARAASLRRAMVQSLPDGIDAGMICA